MNGIHDMALNKVSPEIEQRQGIPCPHIKKRPLRMGPEPTAESVKDGGIDWENLHPDYTIKTEGNQVNKRPFFTEEELAEIKRVDEQVFHCRRRGRPRKKPEERKVSKVKQPRTDLSHLTPEERKEYVRKYSREYARRNRDRLLKDRRERYANDPEYRERCRAKQRKYYAEHRPYCHGGWEYAKKRMETDPEFKERYAQRRRAYRSRPDVVERKYQLNAVKSAEKHKDRASERIAYINKRIKAYQYELVELEKLIEKTEG